MVWYILPCVMCYIFSYMVYIFVVLKENDLNIELLLELKTCKKGTFNQQLLAIPTKKKVKLEIRLDVKK